MTSTFATALAGLFLFSSFTGSGVPDKGQSPKELAYPTIVVSMTGYNAVAEQTDGDPHTTASGAFSNPEVVAARSVDLKETLPFGTVIEVIGTDSTSPNCGLSAVEEHLGYRVIADSMHSRKRNQIDILLDNEPSVKAAGRFVNPAVALGVCKEVEIRVIGKLDIKEMPKTQRELRARMASLELANNQPLALKKF